jgi:hypothetical protein
MPIKIRKTINLPIVFLLYGIWYFTPREESRFRVFEKTNLRSIFGPTRKEGTVCENIA